MHWSRPIAMAALLLLSSLSAGNCLSFVEAGKHVGETRCITGKVLQVRRGSRGVTYINFCEDYRVCPFMVVVFGGDLKHVGDVRQLQGRVIEVNGVVKMYDGRAEIILRRPNQLNGEAANIPPLPKGYDVEKKGQFSAGTFSHPGSSQRPARKKQGAPIEIEETEASGPSD